MKALGGAAILLLSQFIAPGAPAEFLGQSASSAFSAVVSRSAHFGFEILCTARGITSWALVGRADAHAGDDSYSFAAAGWNRGSGVSATVLNSDVVLAPATTRTSPVDLYYSSESYPGTLLLALAVWGGAAECSLIVDGVPVELAADETRRTLHLTADDFAALAAARGSEYVAGLRFSFSRGISGFNGSFFLADLGFLSVENPQGATRSAVGTPAIHFLKESEGRWRYEGSIAAGGMGADGPRLWILNPDFD